MDAKQIRINLGQWMVDRRTSLNLTQRQLAHDVGMHVTTINRIEKGNIWPTSESLAMISDRLDDSPIIMPTNAVA